MGYFIHPATASPAAPVRPTPRPAPVDNFGETAKNEVPQFFTVESGYRFYSPELGRWLSRDPIEEEGGNNLVAFGENDPLGGTDPYGLWGEKTHAQKTRDWANAIGFRSGAAADIGYQDNAVDSGGTSFWPWPFGDPSYHFDRTTGNVDSRLQHYGHHFSAAKKFCTWRGNSGQDDWDNAVKQMGLALHPMQDWVAHGDFYGAVPHNMFSPQSMLGGPAEKIAAVDNEGYDAKDGPDGRPAGTGFHVFQGNEYAWFIDGSKRITKTKEMTDYALQTFLDHIRRNAKPCGACRAYFLRNDDPHRYN